MQDKPICCNDNCKDCPVHAGTHKPADAAHQIQEPVSALPAPALNDAWKARMLNGQPLELDVHGLGFHPALPDFDESVKSSDFFAALGIELKAAMAEDQMDSDAYEAMTNPDAELYDCRAWTPAKPEGDGWKLVAIFDTEDGPACWWMRDKPFEPRRHESRRERVNNAAVEVPDALREAEAALEVAIARILKANPGHSISVTSEAKALVAVRAALAATLAAAPDHVERPLKMVAVDSGTLAGLAEFLRHGKGAAREQLAKWADAVDAATLAAEKTTTCGMVPSVVLPEPDAAIKDVMDLVELHRKEVIKVMDDQGSLIAVQAAQDAIETKLRSLPATGGHARQPKIMPKGESAAAQLRAMATNYPTGHSWDKLDAKACIRGALEIEALRALLATATGLPAQAVEQTACVPDERLMNSGEPGSLMPETLPALGKTNAGQYSWEYINPPIFELYPKAPSKFTIWLDQRVVVTCYSNGMVEIAEGCDTNEAAKVFWECVQEAGLKLAADAEPQAQADARDAELLDFVEANTVTLEKEWEGPWQAMVYGESESPSIIEDGKTVREAIRAAIAAAKGNEQ